MKSCPLCDAAYPSEHVTCPTDGAVLIETHELAAGRVVRGKYRVLRKLGQGGMGVVYLAEHQMLGGQVALKFLAPELSRNPQFVKRFRNEARAAYQLRHPNIVEVADLDQDEDGSLFIAMEFVNGPNLRSLLRKAQGPLPTDRALGIARGVASGLAAAHARGAVHRDIKPENILLSLDSRNRIEAKVLDFGIAAITENITDLSRTHGLLLTPEYAAPEQWRGTPANELDGRTDLYALGGCLYEMLVGRTPFKASNPQGWMYQHLNGTIEPLSSIRPELERDYPGLNAVVMGLLATEREQRTPSALAFLEEVANWEPQAQAYYVQSARLPSMQEGTNEPQAISKRSGPLPVNTPSAMPLTGTAATPTPTPTPAPLRTAGGTIWQPSVKTETRTEEGTPTTPAPAGQARGATLTTVQVSHKHSLLLIAGGIVLAAIVAFLAAWLVVRSQPANLPPAETPKLSPPGGRYGSRQTVTITDTTPNAIIHYTLDGSPPTLTSEIYVAPLDSLPNGVTLRAMAIAPGHKQSSSMIGFYTWPDQPGGNDVKPPTEDFFAEGKSAYGQKQYTQARGSFKRSCDGGNLDGCNYLGYMLSKGLGGATDVPGARDVFAKACDGKIVDSCLSLGSLYENDGDHANAKKYFQIACGAGSKQACSLMNGVQ